MPLVRGLAGLGPILAQRRIDFARLVGVRVASNVLGTIVLVSFAVGDPTTMGLTIGSVAAASVTTVGTYAVPGFRLGFAFDVAAVRRLIRFARWRFAGGVAHYISTSADDLALGRWAGTLSVGHYRVAHQLGYLPATSFAAAVGRIGFPVFSELARVAPQELERRYLRYVGLTAGLAAALSAAIASLAEPLIMVVLGTQWLPAVAPLIVLCGAAFLRAVAATGGALFLGVGRSDIDAAMQWLRAASLVLLLPLVLHWGALGAAVASFGSVAGGLIIWRSGLIRLGIAVPGVSRAIGRRLPTPAVAAGVAWAVARWGPDSDISRLLWGGASFVSVWLIATVMTDRELCRDLRSSLRGFRAR